MLAAQALRRRRHSAARGRSSFLRVPAAVATSVLPIAQQLQAVGPDLGGVLLHPFFSQERVRRLPSPCTCEPLRRCCLAISAKRPPKSRRSHSAASFISPVCLSFHMSEATPGEGTHFRLAAQVAYDDDFVD